MKTSFVAIIVAVVVSFFASVAHATEIEQDRSGQVYLSQVSATHYTTNDMACKTLSRTMFVIMGESTNPAYYEAEVAYQGVEDRTSEHCSNGQRVLLGLGDLHDATYLKRIK